LFRKHRHKLIKKKPKVLVSDKDEIIPETPLCTKDKHKNKKRVVAEFLIDDDVTIDRIRILDIDTGKKLEVQKLEIMNEPVKKKQKLNERIIRSNEKRSASSTKKKMKLKR